MAVSITRELADTYFSTRLEQEVWDGFDVGLRDKAIVSAKDIITRSLGSTVTDETTDSSSDYYPDRAVYHQGLYMLATSDHTANGELTGPKWNGVATDGEAKDVTGKSIAKESLYWMNWRDGPTIRIARG